MKDKLKRFTMTVANDVCRFVLCTFYLYLFCQLVGTRIMIFQVIAVILIFGLFVSTIVGGVFCALEVIQLVKNRITKKAAAVLDPDELQQ